jgi:hypothetical protein
VGVSDTIDLNDTRSCALILHIFPTKITIPKIVRRDNPVKMGSVTIDGALDTILMVPF